MLTRPITPSTRATTICGNCLENTATVAVHPARISAHNNCDPSCAPHTAV